MVVSSVASFEDGVEIVALQNLSALTESARERIFSHTLPYTARAFAAAHLQNGDLSTMSPEDRQDHLDHTFGGSGVTFLLGSPAGVADSNSAASWMVKNATNGQGRKGWLRTQRVVEDRTVC